mmetsp:Transcript_7521/g.20127  ORF Transcript_7521/g.20127 Transcript_7521/m.20127 type:complete len:303 (-) Transcript_7521:69-977(-)
MDDHLARLGHQRGELPHQLLHGLHHVRKIIEALRVPQALHEVPHEIDGHLWLLPLVPPRGERKVHEPLQHVMHGVFAHRVRVVEAPCLRGLLQRVSHAIQGLLEVRRGPFAGVLLLQLSGCRLLRGLVGALRLDGGRWLLRARRAADLLLRRPIAERERSAGARARRAEIHSLLHRQFEFARVDWHSPPVDFLVHDAEVLDVEARREHEHAGWAHDARRQILGEKLCRAHPIRLLHRRNYRELHLGDQVRELRIAQALVTQPRARHHDLQDLLPGRAAEIIRPPAQFRLGLLSLWRSKLPGV